MKLNRRSDENLAAAYSRIYSRLVNRGGATYGIDIRTLRVKGRNQLANVIQTLINLGAY